MSIDIIIKIIIEMIVVLPSFVRGIDNNSMTLRDSDPPFARLGKVPEKTDILNM